jgi:RNA polymerase sigma factor (sigma-70 family)
MTEKAASPILHLIRRVAEDQHLKELPDQELLRRFSTGRDEAAFSALLRRHGPMVLDICRNMLGNAEDAEDGFQATFLVLAQKAGAIQKKSSVGSWLHGVAYRVALKAQAEFARRQKHEAGASGQTPATASDDFSWRDVQQALHAELNRLSACYRAPLVLCYLEGNTQDEAALLLGVSRATVKKRWRPLGHCCGRASCVAVWGRRRCWVPRLGRRQTLRRLCRSRLRLPQLTPQRR